MLFLLPKNMVLTPKDGLDGDKGTMYGTFSLNLAENYDIIGISGN